MLYSKYVELSHQKAHNVIFGGRLGQYRYYNMDQADYDGVGIGTASVW